MQSCESQPPRFYFVKSHAQKRKLGLQGVEINCSTLWWAKAVHNQVRSVKQPVRDPVSGAWHVLWSMHSSLSEIQTLVHWLKPNRIEGICPVICHEDSPTNPLSRLTCAPIALPAAAAVPAAIQKQVQSPDSASSVGSTQDAILRNKVLASTAAYRTELCKIRSPAALNTEPQKCKYGEQSKIAEPGASLLDYGIGGTHAQHTQPVPQQSCTRVSTSQLAEDVCIAATSTVDDSLPQHRSVDLSCRQSDPACTTPARGKIDEATISTEPSVCASTEQEDSFPSPGITLIDRHCAATQIEEDSPESQVVPINLVKERLPASPASEAAELPRRMGYSRSPRLAPTTRGRWQRSLGMAQLRNSHLCPQDLDSPCTQQAAAEADLRDEPCEDPLCEATQIRQTLAGPRSMLLDAAVSPTVQMESAQAPLRKRSSSQALQSLPEVMIVSTHVPTCQSRGKLRRLHCIGDDQVLPGNPPIQVIDDSCEVV